MTINREPAAGRRGAIGRAGLQAVNLALAVAAALAPMAHVLELPNKLTLDADLWLGVQKHLYQGWGPLLGGPAEIGALLTTLWLLYLRRLEPGAFRATLLASFGYVGMLAAFFLLNAPTNEAVSAWTPATLPPDWTQYRARWEAGHALACFFSIVSLGALWWAARRDPRRGPLGTA